MNYRCVKCIGNHISCLIFQPFASTVGNIMLQIAEAVNTIWNFRNHKTLVLTNLSHPHIPQNILKSIHPLHNHANATMTVNLLFNLIPLFNIYVSDIPSNYGGIAMLVDETADITQNHNLVNFKE